MSVFSSNKPQNSETKSSTDFDGYYAWLEENIGTDPVSETGVISGIIDLGVQPQQWSEYGANEKTPQEEADTIAYWEGKDGKCYFEDGQNDKGEPCRIKKVQKKPTQSFAFTVDFPTYMVPWGNFSENIKEDKPYRMVLNGRFKSELAKVYPMSWENFETNRSKPPVFSLRRNSLPYKLAIATGVLKKGDKMLPQDIPKLLGKAAQFEISLTRNGDFLNDRVKLQGAIPAVVVKNGLVPELAEDFQFVIEMDEQNDQEAVNHLPAAVKNTIKKAVNYGGSVIQGQLGANDKPQSFTETLNGSTSGVANGDTKKAPEPISTPSEGVSDDVFDEDSCPF